MTGDKKATRSDNNNKLVVSQLLPVCNALFRLCCGIWMLTTNMTDVLKERAHLLYAYDHQEKAQPVHYDLQEHHETVGSKES